AFRIFRKFFSDVGIILIQGVKQALLGRNALAEKDLQVPMGQVGGYEAHQAVACGQGAGQIHRKGGFPAVASAPYSNDFTAHG
ncbi:MAG: hypothetical protein JG777_3147, partial [Clostridia bacterium]|nr:hypothetical protein [Clostridia bacterium]